MKTCLNCVIALSAVLLGSPGIASQTRVIINLSDQRVSLVQQGRITLVSPIASGKPGWSTPRGNFSVFNKDIDHRSRSFGSVVDTYGRVVNSNATPSSHVPRGGPGRLGVRHPLHERAGDRRPPAAVGTRSITCGVRTSS